MPAVQGPEFCPQHFKINEPGEAEICRGAGDLAKVTPGSVSGEGLRSCGTQLKSTKVKSACLRTHGNSIRKGFGPRFPGFHLQTSWGLGAC